MIRSVYILPLTVAGILLIGHSQKVSSTPALVKQWSLSRDFRTAPNEVNPSPDRYGNKDVWYYLQSDPVIFPKHQSIYYTLLRKFVDDTFFIKGLEQWEGIVGDDVENLLPVIGINATDKTQRFSGVIWPAKTIRAHPLPDSYSIAGWRSPVQGLISVQGSVRDMDAECGNGITWSVDLKRARSDNITMAHGAIANGGFQSFLDGSGGNRLRSIWINRGDFLYVLIGPKNGDYVCDSTKLDVTIDMPCKTDQ